MPIHALRYCRCTLELLSNSHNQQSSITCPRLVWSTFCEQEMFSTFPRSYGTVSFESIPREGPDECSALITSINRLWDLQNTTQRAFRHVKAGVVPEMRCYHVMRPKEGGGGGWGEGRDMNASTLCNSYPCTLRCSYRPETHRVTTRRKDTPASE